MDSSYRPQSPDLSSYAPRSPDLSGIQHTAPDLPPTLPSPQFGHQPSLSRDQFGNLLPPSNPYNHHPADPTSVPLYPQYQYDQQPPYAQYGMPPAPRFKTEDEADDDYLPDAPTRTSRRARQPLSNLTASDGLQFSNHPSQLTAPMQGMSSDPSLGVQLKTSFPVARIKRIMQADEDIGKVAQVTPHVVSRALELFMIKLISTSAEQAAQSGGGGGGKGPKRILAQHVKKALVADESYDFLEHVIEKVPDAPSKAKKEPTSDSDEGPSKPVKKRGRKRKESADDF